MVALELELKRLIAETPEWTPPGAKVSSKHIQVKPNVQTKKTIAERAIDLADVPQPGDIPLLFGSYLVQGSAHWLTGQTGLGKSTFCYNLACALAEGTELWDIPCDAHNVLYLDMETGDAGRARKIERLYRDTPRVRDRLFFIGEPIKFPDELDDFLAYVEEKGISLVIFDTVRRCFRVKDENDNAEVYNQVVPALDALKRKGVASLTIGHPSKNGGAGARGAGAQEDAGDVNLTLTMHRGEVNDKNGIIALRVTKNRQLGLGVKTLYLQRSNTDDDRFHRVDVDEPADNSEEPGTRAECVAAIVRCVEEQQGIPISYTLLRKAMQEEEHKESTFKRALTQAMAGKLVAKAENGGYILPEGTAG